MAQRLGLEQRYEVKDGPRVITFQGWKLAEADSCINGTEARWTELSLFKTLTGTYVLQKVGRSDVFHNETCEPKKGKRWPHLEDAIPEDASDDDEIEFIFVPCDQCNPDYEDSPVWVEKDLYSTTTGILTAEDLLAKLYRPGTQNTSKYLSRVAQQLLSDAAERDDDIARVLTQPVDVT